MALRIIRFESFFLEVSRNLESLSLSLSDKYILPFLRQRMLSLNQSFFGLLVPFGTFNLQPFFHMQNIGDP